MIPIENIYYLLCYAWNKLDEKEQVKIAVDDRTELVDLFAKVLINGTKILLKRGIDKDYVNDTVDLAGVKGKLELGPTLKSRLHQKLRTICTVDEFSDDVLTNQILVSTLYRLMKCRELDRDLRGQLKNLIWMFPGVQVIELKRSHFPAVQLNRNNRFYGFLLNVCQILYENMLPTEILGELTFMDFTRDEHQMSRLFEAFLLNFYRREFPHWEVKRQYISWQFEAGHSAHIDHLPRMETDISIKTAQAITIIDAKYYGETLRERHGRAKIKSENLYQLFSYLLNQRSSDPVTHRTQGILLYPTIGTEYDLEYHFEQHPIAIKTVNLNMHWRQIEERLKTIGEF